ncbi:hypothetical protein AAJV73_00755 [Cyanobium sp. BSA11S]|uniref:hypothetical protein n=1 Tax=Cyanobium sp. BSA11S TaxID=3108224 RepID=UPI003D817CBD
MQAKLFTAATVQMRPTIVLYRIIGNPLPPRHSPEDTINELKFILEYEPDYEGIEKRWLLNRVFDHSLARDIRDLIRSAGYRLDVIPFSKKEYKSVWEDLEGIPPELHPWQQSFQTEELITQAKVLDYIGRKKNQYIMNNNGARNHAIDLGLADSSWVMPWDSGCFLPEASYEVLHDLMASLGCDVISVPMSRLFGNNALALDRSYVPVDVTEPQLCFSHRTTIRFDERLRYGSCPKAMLLRQLGIPGPWQKWTCIPYWESYAGSEKSNMSGKYVQAGWVYRLTSSSWKDDPKSEATLHHARYKGIVEFIFKVDTSLIESELTYGISLLQSSCANSRDAEVRYDNSHESSCANDNIARDTLCTLAKIAASHQLSDSEVNRLLQDTLLDHDYTSVASVSDSLESLGRGIIRMPATLLARQSFPTSTMILYILVHAFHRNKLSACNKYINDLVGAMFGQSGDGSSPSLRFLSEYGTKKHITDSELARLLFLVPLLESLKIANNAWLAPPPQ